MKKFNVGVIGATGMVGQRFLLLLENHPWFNVTCLAASPASAGKKYKDALRRWHMSAPMPAKFAEMTVMDAEADRETIANSVDFCFCAVNMKKDEIKELEYAYAKLECPIVSNNSAHRFTPDVPMVIPEINASHLEVIPAQKKRLGTKRVIAVYGCDALDEVSLSDSTYCCEIIDGVEREYYVTPEDFGLNRVNKSDIVGGEPDENARIMQDILQGERGARRDAVLANSAMCLYLAGKADSLKEGALIAGQMLDSGAAYAVFNKFVQATNA